MMNNNDSGKCGRRLHTNRNCSREIERSEEIRNLAEDIVAFSPSLAHVLLALSTRKKGANQFAGLN